MADGPVAGRVALEAAWDSLRDVVARAGPARLGGILLGVVALGAAGWWVLRPPPAPTPQVVLPAAVPMGAEPADASAPEPLVVVHVAGAVERPGVLRLPEGARVADAVAAAGGPLPQADLGALNLAARVADGERIHVPRPGEVPPPLPRGSAGEDAAEAPVDLNRASASELEALPGVGPATAAAIVEHRVRHGPFSSVDDLRRVKGIGDAKLAALRDRVRV